MILFLTKYELCCVNDNDLDVGEGHLFATHSDLRPPPLQGNLLGIKVQITRQKVWHVRFVRYNPFSSSHVSGGRHQTMENEKCNFLT